MFTTVIGCLVFAAFLTVILSALGKAPLWIAVFFLALIHLLDYLPLK